MLDGAPAWMFQSITRFIFDLAKYYMIALGVTLLVGGSHRMSSPGYTMLTQWAAWWVWGGTMLAFGLLSLIPVLYARRVAYTCAAVWFWFWWAAFTANAIWETAVMDGVPKDVPVPGWTAVPTYLDEAMIFTALAVAMWMDRPRQKSLGMTRKWQG